jgi:hypothetical protein
MTVKDVLSVREKEPWNEPESHSTPEELQHITEMLVTIAQTAPGQRGARKAAEAHC